MTRRVEGGEGGGETNSPPERPFREERVRRTASERGWCLGWAMAVVAVVVLVVAGRQPGRPRANGDNRVDARRRESE